MSRHNEVSVEVKILSIFEILSSNERLSGLGWLTGRTGTFPTGPDFSTWFGS